MRLRWMCLVLSTILLAMPTVASAEIGFAVKLVYTRSFDAKFEPLLLNYSTYTMADGTTRTHIAPDPCALDEWHVFSVRLTTFGLSAGQDGVHYEWGATSSGCVVPPSAEYYDPDEHLIDPPFMATP